MLMRVLVKANRFGQGYWPRKRAYLHGYFFEEYTGLGLPADFAFQSAIHAQNVLVPGRGDKNPRSDLLGSEVGSSLSSFLGSNSGGYSTLGDSASVIGGSGVGSGLGDLSGLADVIKRSIEEGLAGVKPPMEESGKGGGTCMYCHKSSCPMLSGGKPCREANRAAGLLREKQKAEREGKKAEKSE